jgi:hypothetical protein
MLLCLGLLLRLGGLLVPAGLPHQTRRGADAGSDDGPASASLAPMRIIFCWRATIRSAFGES